MVATIQLSDVVESVDGDSREMRPRNDVLREAHGGTVAEPVPDERVGVVRLGHDSTHEFGPPGRRRVVPIKDVPRDVEDAFELMPDGQDGSRKRRIPRRVGTATSHQSPEIRGDVPGPAKDLRDLVHDRPKGGPGLVEVRGAAAACRAGSVFFHVSLARGLVSGTAKDVSPDVAVGELDHLPASRHVGGGFGEVVEDVGCPSRAKGWYIFGRVRSRQGTKLQGSVRRLAGTPAGEVVSGDSAP